MYSPAMTSVKYASTTWSTTWAAIGPMNGIALKIATTSPAQMEMTASRITMIAVVCQRVAASLYEAESAPKPPTWPMTAAAIA